MNLVNNPDGTVTLNCSDAETILLMRACMSHRGKLQMDIADYEYHISIFEKHNDDEKIAVARERIAKLEEEAATTKNFETTLRIR